jgi:hypothetical protein
MLTMFREGGKDSPVSMRRVLAFFFALAAVALGVLGFRYADKGWFVFIPCGACLVAVLLLLFFTTWTDLANAARALKGEAPTPGAGAAP